MNTFIFSFWTHEDNQIKSLLSRRQYEAKTLDEAIGMLKAENSKVYLYSYSVIFSNNKTPL